MQSLRSISEFLVHEEEKYEKEAERAKKQGDINPSMWKMEESTGVAFIQQLLPSILQHALHENLDARKYVLYTLRISLRQGLIVPATYVPHLVGFTFDTDESIRSTSLQLLEFILSKSHNFVRCTQVMEGYRIGFTRIKASRLETKSSTVAYIPLERTLCQPLYEFLGKIPNIRQQFISSLLAPKSENFAKGELLDQVGFTEFVLDCLAFFHYSTENEILQVLHYASLFTSTESRFASSKVSYKRLHILC